MKKLKLFSLGILCFIIGIGFYGCADKSPSKTRPFQVAGYRHKLFGVDFADSKNGWISGDYGLLIKTSDGGETWAPQTTNTILPLRGVSFVDTSNGWAVGDQGIILHTSDGGKTWVKQESGIKEHLTRVKFLNSQKGFAMGVFASLLMTEDGGQTWQDISQKVKEPEKEVKFFIDQEALKEVKTDTGAEEAMEESVSEEGMPVLEPLLNDVYFIDPQNGWIVGEEGNVFHTKDGGGTWQKKESGVEDDLFGICFKDTLEGWITGLNGILLHTENGGDTWTAQECPTKETLFRIVVSGSRGYTVGNAGSVIRSNDGGKTWELFKPEGIPLFSWLRDIKVINGKFVVIGALGTVLLSDNEGEKWKQIT